MIGSTPNLVLLSHYWEYTKRCTNNIDTKTKILQYIFLYILGAYKVLK